MPADARQVVEEMEVAIPGRWPLLLATGWVVARRTTLTLGALPFNGHWESSSVSSEASAGGWLVPPSHRIPAREL